MIHISNLEGEDKFIKISRNNLNLFLIESFEEMIKGKIEENHKLGYLNEYGKYLLTNISSFEADNVLIIDEVDIKYADLRSFISKILEIFNQYIHNIFCLYLDLDIISRDVLSSDRLEVLYKSAKDHFIKLIFFSKTLSLNTELKKNCDILLLLKGDEISAFYNE